MRNNGVDKMKPLRIFFVFCCLCFNTDVYAEEAVPVCTHTFPVLSELDEEVLATLPTPEKLKPELLDANRVYSIHEVDLTLPAWRDNSSGIDVSGLYQCKTGELLSIHQHDAIYTYPRPNCSKEIIQRRVAQLLVTNINKKLGFLERMRLYDEKLDKLRQHDINDLGVEEFSFYSDELNFYGIIINEEDEFYSLATTLLPLVQSDPELCIFKENDELNLCADPAKVEDRTRFLSFSYSVSNINNYKSGFSLIVDVSSFHSSLAYYVERTLECTQIF